MNALTNPGAQDLKKLKASLLQNMETIQDRSIKVPFNTTELIVGSKLSGALRLNGTGRQPRP